MNGEKESDIFRELINQVHGKSEITFIPLQIPLFMTFFPRMPWTLTTKMEDGDRGWQVWGESSIIIITTTSSLNSHESDTCDVQIDIPIYWPKAERLVQGHILGSDTSDSSWFQTFRFFIAFLPEELGLLSQCYVHLHFPFIPGALSPHLAHVWLDTLGPLNLSFLLSPLCTLLQG